MKRILLLLFLVPSIGQAQWKADEVNYTWVRAGYMVSEMETTGPTLDSSGFGIDGSVEVRDHMLLFASYDSLELDDFPGVKTQTRTIGLGAHVGLGERISLFGQIGYVDIGTSDAATTADDEGARAIAGIRLIPLAGFELRGGVDHLELDGAGGDTGVFVGSDLWLTDQFALSADAVVRDDTVSLLFAGRIYFGGSPL